MTKKASIAYISSLLSNPASVTDTEGGQAAVAAWRKAYPYFVPVRYIDALESHKKEAWPPAMLSAIQPYAGNWMLFHNFIEAGNGIEEEIPGPMPEDDNPVSDAGNGIEEKIPEPVQQDDKPVSEAVMETADVPAFNEPVADTVINADITFFTEVIEEAPPAVAGPVAEAVIIEIVTLPEAVNDESKEEATLIVPIHSQDYFLHQAETVSEDIPDEINELKQDTAADTDDKSLMVMMSFSEWLRHFKNASEKQKEEAHDRKALRTMWQKEKLAAAMEEENEEIPENVFEMAVNSITHEDGLASETLADIYIKQGKYDKAIEMYRKLSLRNPQKNLYFARKIDEVLKDKQL